MRGRDTLPELLSMNCCTNTYGHATDNFQLINEKNLARLFRWGVHRVASRRIKMLARWAAIWALTLGAWVPVEGGWLKPDITTLTIPHDYENLSSTQSKPKSLAVSERAILQLTGISLFLSRSKIEMLTRNIPTRSYQSSA